MIRKIKLPVFTPTPDRWQFYRDSVNQWQWRKFVRDKVIIVSADGFGSRQACVNNARTRGYVIPIA
jgi:hypothetical protein